MTTTPTINTGMSPSLPSAPKTVISSDFDTFLKMLTAQMKNQDPLNPLDSTDYATQLATFSGVEQQMKTNDLLANLGSQMNLMGMSQLAGWIGQEARANTPVWMDGDPVTMNLKSAVGADRAMLVAKNARGEVVSRDEVPLTPGLYDWMGLDATGAAVPDGTYSLSLESYFGDKLLATTPVETYSRIFEARTSPTGTILVLEGGIEVAATAVTALREPPTAPAPPPPST
jgi:flagellar basal-body rod modification protein FlgD